MPFPLDYTVTALVTLLVVVDPVGLAPTFLAVTTGLPPRPRRQVAVRATLIAAAILRGAAAVGNWLLRTLGISLPAPSALQEACCCSGSRPRWRTIGGPRGAVRDRRREDGDWVISHRRPRDKAGGRGPA